MPFRALRGPTLHQEISLTLHLHLFTGGDSRKRSTIPVQLDVQELVCRISVQHGSLVSQDATSNTTSTTAFDDERRAETRSLSLEDLKDTKPEYLSNIVVNRWKPSEKSDESYELLTMSSTEIDRLGPDPFKGSLGPADIKLSDAMATSAAALSQHMGKYDNSVVGLTRFHTLLGLEMGASMISDSVRRGEI